MVCSTETGMRPVHKRGRCQHTVKKSSGHEVAFRCYNERVLYAIHEYPMRYLTILFLTISSLGGAVWAQDTGVMATAYQTVNVRSGPGTQYDIIGQLSVGDTVPVLGRDSANARWLYVSLPDELNVRGWVAVFTVTTNGGVDGLEIVDITLNPDSDDDNPDQQDGVWITAFGRVNVRSGPSITYTVIGQLEIEDEAQALARSNYNNDWLFIENDSVEGWVAYFTVTVRGNVDELPVRVPDTISGDLVPPSTLIEAQFNVRLHTRPAFTSSVVGVIPYQTQVTPVGIAPNNRWVYIVYEGVEGWASAALFDITDEQMAQMPRRNIPATPTPASTSSGTLPTQAPTPTSRND